MFALLGGSTAKLVIALLIVAAIAGSGAAVDHKFMEVKILKQESDYRQAEIQAAQQAMARQQAIDKLEQDTSNAELQKQAGLSADLRGQIDYLRAHPVVIRCIPFGLVRVLDAAVLGIPAGNLHLPPGATDAACSPIGAATLARTIISNYARAGANAEQLTALQQWAQALEKVKP